MTVPKMKRRYCIMLAAQAIALLLLPGCGPAPPPNYVHTVEDVDGSIIGALAGTPSERLASERGTAKAFATGEELMFHLTEGTIDCAFMESSVAAELVSNTPGVRIMGEPLLTYDLRFAVPRENDELLDAVNAALAALRGNGTLRGLRDKYFSGRRYSYASPDRADEFSGTLTLAVPPDSPPFSFKDADGGLSGLDIEVTRAVCDVLGVELRVIEYDAWELVTAVRYGRADLALGWLPSEGEEQMIHISEPYANVGHVVIVRR